MWSAGFGPYLLSTAMAVLENVHTIINIIIIIICENILISFFVI